MRYLAVITLLILALAIAQPVAAQSFRPDYKVGNKSYHQKDCAVALWYWRPLAKQGDVHAQFGLGVMYRDGQGVTKDYAEAVRWYRKSA